MVYPTAPDPMVKLPPLQTCQYRGRRPVFVTITSGLIQNRSFWLIKQSKAK